VRRRRERGERLEGGGGLRLVHRRVVEGDADEPLGGGEDGGGVVPQPRERIEHVGEQLGLHRRQSRDAFADRVQQRQPPDGQQRHGAQRRAQPSGALGGQQPRRRRAQLLGERVRALRPPTRRGGELVQRPRRGKHVHGAELVRVKPHLDLHSEPVGEGSLRVRRPEPTERLEQVAELLGWQRSDLGEQVEEALHQRPDGGEQRRARVARRE